MGRTEKIKGRRKLLTWLLLTAFFVSACGDTTQNGEGSATADNNTVLVEAGNMFSGVGDTGTETGNTQENVQAIRIVPESYNSPGRTSGKC
mgnify:CR=1 FL=1